MLTRRLALAGSGAAIYAASSIADAHKRDVSAAAVTDSCQGALPLLVDTGFAVVSGCIPTCVLQSCQSTDAFHSMPTSAGDVQTDTWRLSALGRFHRVKFSAADTTVFEQLEPIFMPLVEAFFREDGRQGGKVYRSELQLLNATPKHSQKQSWHADNVARGITIIVPLVDFTVENGATQILPGSHRLASCWTSLVDGGPRVLTLRAGSIAAYDARLYHRGLGNTTGSSRPALVFRYDREETPPPGVGMLMSIAHVATAKALHASTGAGAALREALFGRAS